MSERTERQILADFIAVQINVIDPLELRVASDLIVTPHRSGLDLDVDGSTINLNASECLRLARILDAASDAILEGEKIRATLKKVLAP